MKSNLRSGLVCIGILLLLQTRQGKAQQAQPPAAPQPAAQQAAPAAPVQQPAPAQPAPAKPKVQPGTSEANTGEGISIEPFYWLDGTSPILRAGFNYTGTDAANLDYPGKVKRGPGAIISAPLGKGNTLRISGFRVQGGGNTVASQNLDLFSNPLAQGDLLVTAYTIQSVKASWDFLTYPFELGGSKFRVMTLWQLQYASIKSNINAPYDANAGPLTPVVSSGSRWVILPALGLGLEDTLSKHFRVNAQASGFAIPHHADLWDVDVSLAFRVGHIEILGGEKLFHFKTSPKNEQYLTQTLSGAYAGVRYYWK